MEGEKRDNRHFVHLLKKARDSGISDTHNNGERDSPRRPPACSEYHDVYVSFGVLNIHAIDQIQQRFHVLFNMYCAWDEDIQNISIGDNDEDLEHMGASWQKDMFFGNDKGVAATAANGGSGRQSQMEYLTQLLQTSQAGSQCERRGGSCFNPQIRFTNCMEWNEDEHAEWFRVVSHKVNSGSDIWEPYQRLSIKEVKDMQENNSSMNNISNTKVRIVWAQRVQGWFEEDFEMKKFPFDVQHLHIGVTSRWDHKKVGISYDKYTPSTVSSQALTSQTWEMCAPRIMSFRDDWSKRSLPLLTEKTDSATAAQYCMAYFALTTARHSGFVMKNVMLIMTMVGFFSFAAFALDPLSLSNRQSVILTLVLTTVAFKYVTMSMMPEIPYLTMLDTVTYGCFLLQALMLLFICIIAKIQNNELRSVVNTSCLGVSTLLWLSLLLWFLIRSFTILRQRERYLDCCDQKYQDAFDTRKFKDDRINEQDLPVPPTTEEFSPCFQRQMRRSTVMKREYTSRNMMKKWRRWKKPGDYSRSTSKNINASASSDLA